MLHEERQNLTEKTQDMKRAIDSLREEFEAVDWYQQRADACKDDNLRKILVHNMNEEKEHAAMLLEWMRQNDEILDEHLKEYLYAKQADIAALEEDHD